MEMLLMAIEEDPVRAIILKAFASYLGISALVVAVIGSLKGMFKEKIDGKEPFLGIIFTFLFGIAAKFVLPDAYGPHTVSSWALHASALVVCALGAKHLHDNFWNVITGKAKKE